MKCVLLFIFIWLSTQVRVNAQSEIFIPINNQECINCLGRIHYFSMLDTNIKTTLVFEKRYRRDSSILIKRLHLENYRNRIIWSDSLYNLFRNDGLILSALSLYNAKNGKIIKTGLVHIEENLPFLNSINKPVDTIKLDQPAFGAETSFSNRGSYFYNFDGLSKEMRVFDKTENKHLYNLSLNDSLIEAAFRLRFGVDWAKALKNIKAYTNKWETIDPQAYSNYFCVNDTVYLLAQHRYMIYPSEGAADTNTTIFLSLSTFKGSKLINFSLVENYLDSLMKGKEGGIKRITSTGKPTKAYYTIPGEFIVHGQELYMRLLGGFANGIPNHFLSRYSYNNKEHIYEFKSFYDKNLPEVYDSIGYNYLTPGYFPFSPPYVSLYLSDHFFSLDDKIPDISLNFFSKNNNPKEKGIWDIKLSKNYAYMIYMNQKNHNYHYLKYDLNKKAIIINKPVCDYKDASFISAPVIDDFDYDYIYSPIDEKSILRKRIVD